VNEPEPWVEEAEVDGVADQLGLRHLGVDERAVVAHLVGAEQPGPARRQVAHGGADVVVGHDDGDTSYGSSMVTDEAAAARGAPATRPSGRPSEESTACDLPSVRVTRRSTIG
jgi:hypothetical protein